jgi:methylglutaconyl-CoA hydratase
MLLVSMVNVSCNGPLAVFELDDPESGNALSGTMVAALSEALGNLKGSDARAVVLTTSGRHFCAGAHLGELEGTTTASRTEQMEDAGRLASMFVALLRCPLPTLAAVRGAAYGGGAGLAAACDLVLAEPESRFQFSEVRLGFVPALISVFLPRRVQVAQLQRLFIDPAPIDVDSAFSYGLVDEIASAADQTAMARAEAICRKASSSAIAVTKKLLLDFTLPDLDARFAHAVRVNTAQRDDPECRRGVAAFLATRAYLDWLSVE